jgi:hypothetical protein
VPPHLRQQQQDAAATAPAAAAAAGPGPGAAAAPAEPATASSASSGGGGAGKKEAAAATATAATTTQTTTTTDHLFRAVLHNAQQFHSWLDQLDRACASEAQRTHGRFAARLTRAADACADVAARLDGTLALLDGVTSLQQAAARRSEELAGTCDALVAERAALADLAAALRARLALFDDYEAAAAELARLSAAEAAAEAAQAQAQGGGAAAAATDDATAASTEALLRVLSRLDGVAARVAAHPHYADAAAYAARLRGLQQRAAALVRGRVGASLRVAARAVATAAAEQLQQQSANSATTPTTNTTTNTPNLNPLATLLADLPEAAEVSLLGVKWRAAAEPPLRPLIAGLAELAASQRASGRAGGADDCGRLLAECRALVAANRAEVLSPLAAARGDRLRREADASALLRSGGEQLLRLARQEAALMDALFGGVQVVAAMLPAAGSGQQAVGSTPFAAAGGGGQAAAATAEAAAGRPPAAQAAADALRVPLEPLASAFYDALRPRVVKLSDLDAICALIDVLQGELMQQQQEQQQQQQDGGSAPPLLHASAAADAARPALERALADLRGRLIFRAQAVVSEAVAGYRPGASDGVDAGGLADYPERLEQLAAGGGKAGGGGDGDESATTADNQTTTTATIPIIPPVREALSLLTKLYRRLDARTFGGLAQEALAAATQAVLGPGSRALSARHGSLDAQLFAVSHLLHLRERIGAFEGAEFAAVEVDLDFTHMYGHVRRLLVGGGGVAAAGGASTPAPQGSGGLLASAASAAMMIARPPRPDAPSAGAVRSLAARLDAKRDLERALKAACEDLIMALTRQAADPLVAFLTRAAAVSAASSGAAGAAGGGGGGGGGGGLFSSSSSSSSTLLPPGSKADPSKILAKPLREHAFASAERLAEAVAAAHSALDGPLPLAARRAALYLPSAPTRAVLLRPVRSNVSEAYAQVRALVEREYGEEERAAVGLRTEAEVEAALEGALGGGGAA